VPKWQERLMSSKRLGSLALAKYRESFTLVGYAYGVEPHDESPQHYFVSKVLKGYIIPSPLIRLPEQPERPKHSTLRMMGRHQDLIVAADGTTSWAGGLYAYRNPSRAAAYDVAVGVGPDIDVLGLGRSCDKAIDAIAKPESGNILSHKVGHLNDIAEKLLTLEYVAEGPTPPHQ
jgi:hypothetical protein